MDMERKEKKHLISKLIGVAGGLALLNGFLEQISRHRFNHWAKQNRYDWTHGAITYDIYGAGPPLLFVHSTVLGGGRHEWADNFKQLSREYTLYFIDLPGFNQSEKRNITYSSYLYATAINDFIKDVILEPVTVVASGQSAGFAAAAAKLEPQHIKNLIMLNPKQEQTHVSLFSWVANKTLSIPVLGQTIYNILSSRMVLPWILSYNFKNQHVMTPKELKGYYKASHYDLSNGRWVVKAFFDRQLETDLTHLLPLPCPTHIIYGQEKIYIPDDLSTSTVHLTDSFAFSHVEEPKNVVKSIFQILNI